MTTTDPLRRVIARQRAAAAQRGTSVPVRIFGYSAGSPQIEAPDQDYLEGQALLDAAMTAQATYERALAAETRPPATPKAVRAARIKARLWPAGRST
jgi:hypothetical protein